MACRRETAAQTLASIIENEPRAIFELNSKYPEVLTRVVRRCLEKRQGERYQDTSELLRELKSVSEVPAIPPIPPRFLPSRRVPSPMSRPLAEASPLSWGTS